ncbi:hypothetical protein E2C01_100997 [Portunus trituberculatus]|uniref:Uncharacterized protein n=1 Tax=Portunus trituberculatus TaxID=210409 RepID=A0A5B7KKW5_PORTR|nr:hypothetical protein [Portunus trituberculatus]
MLPLLPRLFPNST